jgi:hypothetical protein
MLIDCDTCTVRGLACSDCVVTVLLAGQPPGPSEHGVDLDAAEQRAIAALADSGLVPPLRLAGTCAGHPVDRPPRAGPPRPEPEERQQAG